MKSRETIRETDLQEVDLLKVRIAIQDPRTPRPVRLAALWFLTAGLPEIPVEHGHR